MILNTDLNHCALYPVCIHIYSCICLWNLLAFLFTINFFSILEYVHTKKHVSNKHETNKEVACIKENNEENVEDDDVDYDADNNTTLCGKVYSFVAI